MFIKKLVGRILFPKYSKFNDEFMKAMVTSVDETGKFNDTSRELASIWLVAAPVKYFIELFLEGNIDGNHKISKIFCDSVMIKADECFMISQAFFVRNIMAINRNNGFNGINFDLFTDEIKNKMHNGKKLLELSYAMDNDIKNIHTVEDMFMPYILRVLSIQYRDIDEHKSGELRHYFDPITAMCFTSYTTEFIIECKNRTMEVFAGHH